jgi:hypothetical protein
VVVSGLVALPLDPSYSKHVVIVMKKLPSALEVAARMTETMNLLTSGRASRTPAQTPFVYLFFLPFRSCLL